MANILVVQASTPKSLGAHREYIGRPSVLGNPFRLGPYTRDAAIDQYDVWLLRRLAADDAAIIAEFERLGAIANRQTLELQCHCAPLQCHGDVIKRILEETLCG